MSESQSTVRSIGAYFKSLFQTEPSPNTHIELKTLPSVNEIFPRFENYSNRNESFCRPTIEQLHHGNDTVAFDVNETVSATDTTPIVDGHHKLGWIQGVLIPVLLNIWGVMLFLRLSWVVGQAGMSGSLLIVLVSYVVCTITTLSLSALSTNGEVKGGGIYFIISRSLGAEFGASIGLVFAVANAISASMNTIGFCDSLNELLKSNGLKIIDNGLNDTRIIGLGSLVLMIVICLIGMDWETKAQNVLVCVISLAIFGFVAGAVHGPHSSEDIAQGFVGLDSQTFYENWFEGYAPENGIAHSFFTVFAIFFPSVTGIQAGANISGDLKDPSYSIPKGTLLALVISMISYIVFILISGASMKRTASGLETDVFNDTVRACSVIDPACKFGLLKSYEVMQLISHVRPLIYAGCFSATISTALTNIVSVPKLIQALGNDKIYPGLGYFARGFGPHNEPYRGYVITFAIAAIFIAIGDLNAIAPLISNFYLASYALINFCAFHAALVRPLGWRPTFKYCNRWLSLAGFILCVIIMFLIDWKMSLLTFLIVLALYLYVVYRDPNVNWGSSMQAEKFKNALAQMYQINNATEHVKFYQPNLLVLPLFDPDRRNQLLDMAHLITKQNSFMIVQDIYETKLSLADRRMQINIEKNTLESRKIKCFYNLIDGIESQTAIESALQIAGLGKLRPNILMIGYKTMWRQCSSTELDSFFNAVHGAFDYEMGLVILRDRFATKSFQLSRACCRSTIYNGEFRKKQQQRGTIDVWWLYDDGGLAILIPYILSKRRDWSHLPVRIFALTNSSVSSMDADYASLALLLRKFRIDYHSLQLFDISVSPQRATVDEYHALFDSLDDTRADQQFELTVETLRQLRLCELVRLHSSGAVLVTMSLPVPQQDSMPATIFMAWLEILSADMPTVLFIRGNQIPVLSLHSE